MGPSVKQGLLGSHGMSVQIDINDVVTTDDPANWVRTSPSSDSGIHSLGEQWEDISVTTTDAEEEQNRMTQIFTPTQRGGGGGGLVDTCVPTNTEEDKVTIWPLIDCLSKEKSDESPEIDMMDSDSDSQWNESEEFYSDQELTMDESSYADYETWSYDKENTPVMWDPVDPPDMPNLHRQHSIKQSENGSVKWTGTDGGNSDICNLSDFSSDEEDIPVEWKSGRQDEDIIGVMTCTYDHVSDSEDSEWEEAKNRKVSEFVNHDDSEYGDRPVANAASELIRKPDRILVGDTLPSVIDHPEQRENTWCDSTKRDIPVRSDEMTCMCLLTKTVLPGTHLQAELIDINGERLDHQCRACWYPDSNNHPDAHICWNCRCLMALCCCVSRLVTVVTSRLISIDQLIDCRHTFTGELRLLGNLMTPCDVIRLYVKMNGNFKGGIDNVMIEYNDTVDSRGLQRCADGHHSSLAHALARDKPIQEKGRFGYTGTPVTDADWLYGRAVLFVPVENVRIGDIRSAVDRRQSTDAAPVTESLVLYMFLRLYDYCAAGYTLSWTFCDTVLENLRAPEQWLRCGILPVYRTMEGAALVNDRVGVTFDVELCVPWDAQEAVVDINSADVVTLGSVPDKVGLVGRRKDAAPSRILQGRDSRSVRFLVPDVRGVDQNFHDVTIVDMDDEREPKVMLADLCHLRDSWPPDMKWSQQKREFTQSRPMPCKYCGKVIRCNMYRHVARLHLDLAQLWRCTVSWCTVWRGTPQDCMEHLRNGHDVPWISKTASIERFVPPWTVCRELWTESLRQEHFCISTDIMLFSNLCLSLTHHYRVYRGGLPHAAYRGDYMTRLRALLPTPPSMNGEPTSSPEAVQGATPRSKRRVHRPFRPVRVMSAAVGELPVLTLQDPADVVRASVIDCRPPVLPVSIPLRALSPTTIENSRGASVFNPSRTEGQSIMDMDTNEITIDRIFPWNELPTPALSPVQCTTPTVMTG